jgi:intein-encoded DNA endonuclease-like protein
MENKSAYVWLLMRMHYRPAILEGSTKTAIWLEAHKAEIKQMHKEAFKKSGDRKNPSFDFDGMAFLRERYEATFTESEREAFEVYLEKHPEELEKLAEAYKNHNFVELINFVGKVKSQKGGRP